MKDIIGSALLAYNKGNHEDLLTVHCSHTEVEEMPLSYFFREHNEMPSLEKIALGLVKGTILDIGAGAGSHALILEEQGYDVTSLEISEGACEVMNSRGLKKVICKSIYDFSEGRYETITLLMNGVGVAGSLSGLEAILMKLKSLLKEGGQILLDSSDITYLYEDKDGSVWVDLNSAYFGELTYRFEYKGIIGDSFSWLFLPQSKLIEVANNFGFECQILKEGDHYDYLARLTVMKS
jgi:SAM-dependent methyltransferase